MHFIYNKYLIHHFLLHKLSKGGDEIEIAPQTENTSINSNECSKRVSFFHHTLMLNIFYYRFRIEDFLLVSS